MVSRTYYSLKWSVLSGGKTWLHDRVTDPSSPEVDCNIVLSSTENKRNLNMRLCLNSLLTQFTDSDSLLTAHLWPAAVAVHVTLNQSQPSDSFNTAELCFSHLILYVCVCLLESSFVSICARDFRIVCSD